MDESAELLSTSRSNVTHRLTKLEKELGVQLVTRAKGSKEHRHQLTAAGNLLLRYTDRLLALALDALAAAKDLQEVKTGSMFVGASQTTGVYLMPLLIEQFKQKHPNIVINLQVENTRRCCLSVSRGELDIAVVGGAIPGDLEHILQVTPYKEDEVVIIVPKAHHFTDRSELSKEDLASLKFVSLHKSSTVQGIKNVLEQQGIDWKSLEVVMEVNSVEAIKNAVEVGLGAAFVSKAAVSKEVELGRLHMLGVRGVRLARTLSCVTDPVRYCSKALRAFIREMFGLTVASGSFPCSGQEIGLTPGSAATMASRYPALQGRGPSIADMSDLCWNEDAEECQPVYNSSGPGNSQVFADASSGAGEKVPFSLVQLVVFRTVARTGSLTAAGLALNISQPAISKSLSGLEQVFGGPLVARNARVGPTPLTELGNALQPYCDSMLAVAAEAVRALVDFQTANTGVVTLGASQTVGTYIMPRLIAAFRQRNPQVTVQLQVDKSRRVCDAVASGDVDVAIIGGEVPQELQEKLQVTAYAQDEFVLIVPQQHELAHCGAIDKSELQALTFVSLNQGSTVQAAQESTLRAQGIFWRQLNIDMEFNSTEAIKGAVQCGLGVAFVSTSAIEKELHLGLVHRVDIRGVRLTRTLHLVSNPGREHSLVARKFMADVFAMVPDASGRINRPALVRYATQAARPWGARPVPGRGAPV
ncbi:hypothetical protein WJX72_004627 [[Myrmecia] bisecta]|uniref:Probable RuBisCO transcriptional regulator n=1 Tax=[Myrmecia] bisecta TaxID=41462 RepID=A0AAW1QR05_9CHLO